MTARTEASATVTEEMVSQLEEIMQLAYSVWLFHFQRYHINSKYVISQRKLNF